jgi:predicted AAA+ superfamily ATPase
MVERRFWQRRIAAAWAHRSVVWLMGVRRAGKSVLCQSIDAEYFDCELPSTRRLLSDAESFLAERRGRAVVLDEVHRLAAPAELLKIAADHFPTVRILATGSSTLGASAHFRDTLTGRKAEVWMTPMVGADLTDFGRTDVAHRLLRGGLPPFFLPTELPERDFQEWMDAYWAKDIQELFRLERRSAFQQLVELVMRQSGGVFEATAFARPLEISRTTVANYVAVLEATFVAHLLRPYAAGGAAEITSAPKVYGFDTGFVCYHRGWSSLRADDFGPLWEHLVLNELHAHVGRDALHYWRTKQGAEVDLIYAPRGREPVAIECKWSTDAFDPRAFKAFRSRYATGQNFVVSQNVPTPFTKRYGTLSVRFVALEGLVRALTMPTGRPKVPPRTRKEPD